MTVDTLSLAKELRAAELSSTQADAIGRAVVEGAATKADVAALRADLKGDLQLVRSDLETVEHKLREEIERLRSSLLIWFVATILMLSGVIIAVVKL